MSDERRAGGRGKCCSAGANGSAAAHSGLSEAQRDSGGGQRAGRVMRGVLEALWSRGRASTSELASALGIEGRGALVSLRRALGLLVQRGDVVRLGQNLGGEAVFCLAARRDELRCPWESGAGAAQFAETFGRENAAFARRMFYSRRLPPRDREQRERVSVFEG